MKGTLFSSDFIEDSNGNLRLLEVNTDTGFIQQTLTVMDFTDFVSVLSSNNITEVVVIHKIFQTDFVNKLKEVLSTDATFITNVSTIVEESSTVYPTSVTDDVSKFILRLAYDESALFDSEYAKNTSNVLKLFTDNGDSGSITEYYQSGSIEGIHDFLPREVNTQLSPDVIIKDGVTTTSQPLKFVKLSKSTETIEDRYNELIGTLKDDELVLKFYETTGTTVQSIRSYSIIYGSNLDLIHLGSFVVPAFLDKPSSVDSGSLGDTYIRNEFNVKHYFELTTNAPRYGVAGYYGGIFEEEEIQKSDDTYVLVGDAVIGDSFKSYFISGSPDTDLETEYSAWSYPGSELPSGSYLTDSTLINNIEDQITYNIINRLTLEGGIEFRLSGAAYLLVYDSVEDVIKYKSAADITPTVHHLLRQTGGTIAVTANTIDILDGVYHNHIVDMETTDTYFLRAGDAQIKIVTHNCFPAGTKITMSDGSLVNIEDIKSGDEVLSYNFENDITEPGIVTAVKKSTEHLLIELLLEDGSDVTSTALHRVYTKEREWVHAQDIKVGETLIQDTGKEFKVIEVNTIQTEVDVYQLIDVKDNHNYYANTMLVHNFKYAACFSYKTEVEMWNGTTKQIGEVEVGDEVKSTKNGEIVKGIVTEHLTHRVNDVVPFSMIDNVIAEPTHPVLVNGEWIEFGKMNGVENGYKFIDNYYNLEIDGDNVQGSDHNFIVGGFVVSGLGDNKELNSMFMRQDMQSLINSGII